MPFLTTALGIGAIASAAGSTATGIMGAHAAGKAADAQAQAAEDAALYQKESADAALDFNKQMFSTEQANTLPWRQAGTNSVISLNNLMGQPHMAPATAPSGIVGSPTTPQFPAAMTNKQQSLIPRAKGGPTKIGLHYLVGEKGPEELVMHPDGSGTILPHPVSDKKDLIPRMYGGPVDYRQPVGGPRVSGTGNLNVGAQPNQPLASPGNPNGGHSAAAAPAANPFGTQQNNPLITGGSSTPIQNTPFTQWSQQFVAPTMAQAEAEPGYQFQLQQGLDAIKAQGSATGELLDPNAQKSLVDYARNSATTDYGNVYNRALQQYQQAYNIFGNNQNTQFNRLSSLAGLGQTSTNELNSAGTNFAGNTGNILLGSAGQIGQNFNNVGTANASGYVGKANAYGGAIQNGTNQLGQYLSLQQILGQNQTPGIFNYGYGMGAS